MIKVRLLPEAEIELIEAAQWYKEQSLGLDYEFMRCIDEAIVRIARMECDQLREQGNRCDAEANVRNSSLTPKVPRNARCRGGMI